MSTATRTIPKLKAPYPYAGGKFRAATHIWPRIGRVRNLIFPFWGSGGDFWGGVDLIFAEDYIPPIITINDIDCYIANFWRAIQANPDAVAVHANWPVNEADLHARHRWLVGVDFPPINVPMIYATNPALRAAYLAGFGARGTGSDRRAFRERMRTDPDYYDVKIAGWWCWGMCCWIGGGWCTHRDGVGRRPSLAGDGQGEGIHRLKQQMPDTAAVSKGRGVHKNASEWNQKPQTTDSANGVHAKLPDIGGHAGGTGRGVAMISEGGTRGPVLAEGRPQLGDAYARGRGVHSNDSAETCTRREIWLRGWFNELRNRLRTVRVCCGDWHRVCGSRSVTTRIGLTGVVLDPPYAAKVDGKKNRDMSIYAEDCGDVAGEVRKWCIEHGDDPQMRIALCGLDGEHNELERRGWSVVAWKGGGGYGNRNKENKNRERERIWFSPHCEAENQLFNKERTSP